MTIDLLRPQPTSRIPFHLSGYRQVPNAHGCYILTTFDRHILYIGMATDLSRRFRQHLDNPEKTGVTDNGKAIWFYYTVFDVSNLPLLERTWLNQFLINDGRFPVLNKINSPIR